MGKDRFGLRARLLSPNLLQKNVDLKLVISKILSMTFIIPTLLMGYINVTFRSTSIWLNLSESFSKHEGYEYTNVIFIVATYLF